MSAVIEDAANEKKLTGYHLTMVTLVVLIIVVALTTIVGSASSTAQSVESKINPRFTASNDVPNPPIEVSCDKPVLTLALVLDRSASVYGDSNGTAPGQYKDTVNTFLNKLSTEINSRNGEVNVILTAFGSRSVIQNKTNAQNQIITLIKDTASLNDMQDAVNKIWFSQPYAYIEDTNNNGTIEANEKYGMQRSGDPYDVRRGYNPNSDAIGNYSATNWDDALINVASIGSSSYSNPAPGGHIDLALVLTDGQPNVNNGANRTFEPSDSSNFDAAAGRVYAADTVKSLRLGTADRPPMAVRGVLINATEESAMKEVFGEGSDNYSIAENFEADLDKVLQDIIDSIETNEVCQPIYVTPGIDVTLDPNPAIVDVNEGDGYVTIKVTISNTTTMRKKNGEPISGPRPALQNVTLSYPGYAETGLTLGDTPIVRYITVSVPFGGNYPYENLVTVKGSFVPGPKLVLAPELNSVTGLTPVDQAKYFVNINWAPLPA